MSRGLVEHYPVLQEGSVLHGTADRLDNLHGSYTFDEDLSQKLEENEEKEETLNEQMFNEALEEEFGSSENNPSAW